MDIRNVTVLSRKLSDFEYEFTNKLWVITPYYNPMGYHTRRRNYEIFVSLLRESGIPVLTVECAFGDQPYDLPEAMDVIKVRGNSLLWQKERLINLAISWLPPSCEYVAWLDCDLIFLDPDWAKKTIEALQRSPIVQVFETCHQLPQQFADARTEHRPFASFGQIVCHDRSVLATGKYQDHGHPGYGWAARRDILDRHGLYEYAIAGSADHYMAHAAVGDFESPCIARMMFNRPVLIDHFRGWAESFHRSVQGNLGVVSGDVLHLWHGEPADRKYYLRHVELAELGFNPNTDLSAPPGKPLELQPDKLELKEFLASYFALRREDGAQNVEFRNAA